MKEKDIYQLKKGQKINHKYYGICTVDGIIPEFGVKIIPDSKEGRNLLTSQSGMPEGTPLLEDYFNYILNIES
jgi:hypothetical protein